MNCVYMICHKTNTDLGVYIGSTCNFALRRNNHKCFLSKGRHYSPIYKLIQENDGWDAWEMKVLETATTRDEILRLEDKWMSRIKNVVNKRSPIIEDYKQYMRDNAKRYYYNNRDLVLAKSQAKRDEKKSRIMI